MTEAWIAAACADHVRRGREAGVMQVCHGKVSPLRRVRLGDGVIYYSPTEVFGSKVSYRAFTAAGVAEFGEPYKFDMGGGFTPWRLNVRGLPTREVPASQVLSDLSFATSLRNWACGLRYGLMPISYADFETLVAALQDAQSENAHRFVLTVKHHT